MVSGHAAFTKDMLQKLAHNLSPHAERKEARGSIASGAVRKANAMEAGDWREAA